jgi:DnaJ-class molecular chaperone
VSKGNSGNRAPNPGRMIEVDCPTCGGSGRRGNSACGLCKGKGKIKVPAT